MFFTILLILGIVFLESVIIASVVYFIVNYFHLKPINDKIQVKVDNKIINSDVIRDGVKSAIQEIIYENEQEKILTKKMRRPESFYINNNSSNDRPVKRSGGNLIPFNMTDEEKSVLEMFYSD